MRRCVKALCADWRQDYGHSPLLLETFVDSQKYLGTCYKAANWQVVGVTSGYAKMGSSHENSRVPKIMFVYPLRKDFREILQCRRVAHVKL
jgi:hypothetical protein